MITDFKMFEDSQNRIEMCQTLVKKHQFFQTHKTYEYKVDLGQLLNYLDENFDWKQSELVSTNYHEFKKQISSVLRQLFQNKYIEYHCNKPHTIKHVHSGMTYSINAISYELDDAHINGTAIIVWDYIDIPIRDEDILQDHYVDVNIPVIIRSRLNPNMERLLKAASVYSKSKQFDL